MHHYPQEKSVRRTWDYNNEYKREDWVELLKHYKKTTRNAPLCVMGAWKFAFCRLFQAKLSRKVRRAIKERERERRAIAERSRRDDRRCEQRLRALCSTTRRVALVYSARVLSLTCWNYSYAPARPPACLNAYAPLAQSLYSVYCILMYSCVLSLCVFRIQCSIIVIVVEKSSIKSEAVEV